MGRSYMTRMEGEFVRKAVEFALEIVTPFLVDGVSVFGGVLSGGFWDGDVDFWDVDLFFEGVGFA